MARKLALLNDRLYVNADLVDQGHLEAFTHRYMVRTTVPVGSGRACGNCKYWMKPWNDNQGKQQYCHEMGYEETDSCSDFEARTETLEVEHVLESFKKVGSVYAFARGDIGKIIRTFPDVDIVDERVTPPMGYDLKFTSQLREDQLPIVATWLKKGYGIIKSPTGSGKSVLLSYLIAKLGLRTLILSHETRHLDTLYQRLCEHTNIKQLEEETGQQIVGRFLEGTGDFPIMFSTFQAFGSERGKLALPDLKDSFGLVWVDECFPAGTIVDGRPIETLRSGDRVACFDPTNPTHVLYRTVLRTMKREPSGLVRIRVDGRWVTCTPSHKVWTTSGWLPAADCLGATVLVRDDDDAHQSKNALRRLPQGYGSQHSCESDAALSCLQSEQANSTVEAGNSSMPLLWRSCSRSGEASSGSCQKGPRVLFQGTCDSLVIRGQVSTSCRYKSSVCLWPYEASESYDGSRGRGKDESVQQGSHIFVSRREWPVDTAPDSAGVSPELADRASDPYGTRAWSTPFPSALLQGGHRERRLENSDRSRRQVTQTSQMEVLGQAQNNGTRSARVDRVEVLERGSDGTFGGMCPDGYVYNIEVEDVHTYFANGLGVSNCHHTSAPTYHSVFSSFNSMYRGGTTATPTRKDQMHWATYNSIGPITAEGGNEMLSCNVSWMRTGISIPSSLFRFTKYGWSRMLDWLGQNSDLKQQLLDNVLRDITAGYKPLVICERRVMVDYLKNMLTHSGYNVEVIVGGQAKKKSTAANKMGAAVDFDALSRRLLDGTVHAVIGTNVLNENIDIRPLDCLHLPFPSANPEMEEQRAGRIRRPLHKDDIAAGFVKNNPEIRVYCFEGHRIAAAGETTRKAVYERLGFTGVGSSGTTHATKKKRLSLNDS